MKPQDVAIIGAGPAGIAAAIQLLRGGVRPILFDAGLPGGLLWDAHRVENYPGFARGISGPRLARRMVRHLRAAGGAVTPERVESLAVDETFAIRTGRTTHAARIVLLATGTRPQSPQGMDIADDARGAVYRSARPLARSRNRRIAIVGGGDAAFDYALNLARRNQVMLLLRGEAARCLPLLERRAAVHPRIRIVTDCRLSSVERVARGVRMTPAPGTSLGTCEADAVVLAVGREPDLELLAPWRAGTREELVAAGRLFLIGDVAEGRFRQTSIAVCDGVRAAMEICERQGESRNEDR